jgi:hypothetical protein
LNQSRVQAPSRAIFAEKILSIAGSFAAMILLPQRERTVAALLFSLWSRHARGACPYHWVSADFFGVDFRAENPRPSPGSVDMRRLKSLLSAAGLRVGRRLAGIVAIAAASLPAAGA